MLRRPRGYLLHWAQLWPPLLCALVAFTAMQIPVVERTFVGAPDREMVDLASRWRSGLIGGPAAPIVWLDIDTASILARQTETYGGHAFGVKSETDPGLTGNTPHDILADLLDYARSGGQNGARAVVLDRLIQWRDSNPAHEAALLKSLQDWSADPNAPLLLVAVEAVNLNNNEPILPRSPYDGVIAAAANIEWSSVRVLADPAGSYGEYLDGECVLRPDDQGRGVPVFVPFVAYQAAAIQGLDLKEPMIQQVRAARKIIFDQSAQARARCTQMGPSSQPPLHGDRIQYHIRPDGAAGRLLVKQVSANWAGSQLCLSRPNAFTSLSAMPFLNRDVDGDTSALCGAVAIIGASNALLPDTLKTPIGAMPGPMVLGNVIRGHVLEPPNNSPIVKALRAVVQLIFLFIIVILVVWGFEQLQTYRQSIPRRIANSKARKTAADWRNAGLLFVTHPVVFKFISTFLGFVIGLLGTIALMRWNIVGIVSAPIYFASLWEAIRWYQERAPVVHGEGV